MEDFGADAGTVRMPPPLLYAEPVPLDCTADAVVPPPLLYACPALLPMAAEVVLPERLTDDMPEV